MRYLIVLTLALALIVGVETAQAQCGCLLFAQQFAQDKPVRQQFDAQLKAQWPNSYYARKRIKKGIGSYAARGDFKDPFCKRYKKACKAAKACILAAGPVYVAQVARGHSGTDAAIDAMPACVSAVLTVYLIA